MAAGGSLSVVEYFGGDDGHRCGYCKNATGNFSHGMWAHSLTVQDYQDLIDRGWRRSGKYVYKPFMSKTCCPQYTIRCHALNFHPSKTHKKVLKKMTKFLSKGEKPAAHDAGCDGLFDIPSFLKPLISSLQRTAAIAAGVSQTFFSGEQMDSIFEEVVEVPLVAPVKIMHTQVENPIISSTVQKDTDAKPSTSETSREETVLPSAGKSPRLEPKPGVGADPCKPQCRKAKDIRKERRLQKEQKKQQDGGSISTNPKPATGTPASGQPKPLEEFITDSLPDDPLHRLEVRLVRSMPPSPQFKASFDASYQVYKLYQTGIHHDPPDKPSESQVRLVPVRFEDPDFLSSYKQSVELFARYQMAIHDDDPLECDESQFKRFLCDSPLEGQYLPSDLLCPETYTWVPIEKCVPRLETSAYSRLLEDARAGDVRALKDLGRVLVLHKRTVMPYAAYSRKRKGCNDEKEVEQYARLLGQTCAERILLYRS
ncbi:arginyl-tRNA--protein transferase 1 isoform X8 [Tachysurus fulvidraco]|uniref:arginyl-tRNA--protein transferase 1 isoform X8 n=1 Tax=Tachysurus fulvidraco TaxID=1234273 RepID=UPI001FEF5369|nr:arginyl-tRNA--protein transferase 1 isoform X8 [Tachysurus fulvidraco]